MKSLIVEDDFVSRRLLQKIVSEYGPADIAVNGLEAIEMFKMAHDDSEPYDLICLDIMMPKMDGQEALHKIREIESSMGIYMLDGVKIIMVTALDDRKNILKGFNEGCESYVVKPIDREKILKEITKLGFSGEQE
ncbi:MAG: response regulator [Fibrobacterota bacterium]